MPKETEAESRYLYKPQESEPQTPKLCRAPQFCLSQKYVGPIRDMQLCTHLTLSASQSLKLSILPPLRSNPVRHDKMSKYIPLKKHGFFSFVSKRCRFLFFSGAFIQNETGFYFFLFRRAKQSQQRIARVLPPQNRLMQSTLTNKKLVWTTHKIRHRHEREHKSSTVRGQWLRVRWMGPTSLDPHPALQLIRILHSYF